MTRDRDLLLEKLRQCHENIRNADIRKDAIVVIYLAGTFTYHFASGQRDNSGSGHPFVLASLSLLAMGVICSLLLTWFRAYHTGYALQAQWLADEIENRVYCLDTAKFLKWGTESIIYIAVAITMLLNVYVILTAFSSIPLLSKACAIIVTPAAIAWHVLRLKLLDHAVKRGGPKELPIQFRYLLDLDRECAVATAANYENEKIRMSLNDGRVIEFDPRELSALELACPEQLKGVRVNGNGTILRWDVLNVDIPVHSLLQRQWPSPTKCDEAKKNG